MRDYGVAIQQGSRRYTLIFLARESSFRQFSVEPSGWNLLGVAPAGAIVPHFSAGDVKLDHDSLLGMKCESSSVAYIYADGSFKHFFMTD